MRKQGSFSHLLGKSVVILAFNSFNCGYWCPAREILGFSLFLVYCAWITWELGIHFLVQIDCSPTGTLVVSLFLF